jgi:hypothetical protein
MAEQAAKQVVEGAQPEQVVDESLVLLKGASLRLGQDSLFLPGTFDLPCSANLSLWLT